MTQLREIILPGWDTPYGYCLFVSKEGLQYRLMCGTETVYLLELYLQTDIIVKKQNSVEITLWRTNEYGHQHAIQGLTHRLFEFVLDRYIIVVTGKQQTSDNKNFWTRQVSWALNRKYNVCVSNDDEEGCPLTQVTDFHTYIHDELYHRHLIVISKKNSSTCKLTKEGFMDKKSITEEINELVLKAVTPGMTPEEREAQREKITHEVLEEKAKLAKLCPNEVKKVWTETKNLGQSLKDLAHKLGL